jgi:hypothetical protein
MSQKNVGAILLLIATALGGPVAVQQAVDVQDQVLSSVAIEGPNEAVVGELIELHVSGSRPSWLPPTVDAREVGDTLYISFREDGTYEVIASAIAGQRTKTVKHEIVVGVKPEPKPEPDSPVPTPTPEPKPGGELTESVYKWCVEANVDRDVARELGMNFEYAATKATDIDELLSYVSERNRKVDQKTATPVLAKIQQHLFDNLAGTDFETHQCAFDEIGQGFLRYAGEDTGSPGQRGFWR